jgi:ABC-type spermidine/putrescine transport system permease subunit I
MNPAWRRLILAFLIAPVVAPAAYAAALVALIAGQAVFGSASLSSIGGAGEIVAVVAAIGVPVAYAAALLAPRLRGELFSIRFPLWAGILLGILSAEVFRRLLLPRNSGESDA